MVHTSKIFMSFFTVSTTVMGGVFFFISHKITLLKEDIAHLQNTISTVQNDMKTLQAEWSYLNHPDRVAKLAEKHSKMRPLSPSKVKHL